MRVRTAIALGWRRAALAGLDPGMPTNPEIVPDWDRRSRLARAAAPVLDDLGAELAESRFCVLTADRSAAIIDRRVGQRGLGTALDRVLAVPGARFVEERTGTNALATAHELHAPVSVIGGEHFLESLRDFCCYAAPIRNPVTRRLEGVLDITGRTEDATPLLGPLVQRAVHDIEQRLLQSSTQAEQRLLAEFQAHPHAKSRAVMALGENVVLSNRHAVEIVRSCDHATLRAIAEDLTDGESRQTTVTLASGAQVLLQVRSIPEARGALFGITSCSHKASHAAASATGGSTSRVAVVVGEPGTGRTTAGRRRAGPQAVVLDAAEGGDWIERARAALAGTPAVLVDNIDLLPDRTAALLAQLVVRSAAHVVLTTSPLDSADTGHLALTATALERMTLPPLRERRDDFPWLVHECLARVVPGTSLTISASALQLLAAYSWPGNLRELHGVLTSAARDRLRGDIIDSDLPATIRQGPPRGLSGIEVAEHDAIVAALRATRGNKVAAAARLGIGRTTLYQRLRRYHVT
ncbi:sigma-54-dependent Fis family transcriptional regulator [Mycobacterium sp. E1747]|uniref:sigma-54-dependent Fis family transcriptional regulator n=1 Tax=Mycobacterium sp. E1747 TaxID=1834128 RepID=UPI00080154E9|nr:helix-turn-helix domain-containing protein [Mycobacterium sp. E1747]OBH13601.1 hypothetical protein A5695_13625 [Mycobacterium sp. E1747]